ncbi:MAG: hypothetical protein LBU35_00365 [Holosporales bacterium]|nr:hypothetical protein [Holosporales bacterium]
MKFKLIFLSVAIIFSQNVGNSMENGRDMVELALFEMDVPMLSIGDLKDAFVGIKERIRTLPDVISCAKLTSVIDSSDHSNEAGKVMAVFFHITDAFRNLKEDKPVKSPILYERYENGDLLDFIDIYSGSCSLLDKFETQGEFSSDDTLEFANSCYDMFKDSYITDELFSEDERSLLECYLQAKRLQKVATATYDLGKSIVSGTYNYAKNMASGLFGWLVG